MQAPIGTTELITARLRLRQWRASDLEPFAGLRAPSFEAHFTPCIEIGWRLERSSWGQGFASEAGGSPLGHPLRRHVLHRLTRAQWRKNPRSEQTLP
jgi:hypothetical protein